jgi:OmpA-OmpF porin, OOP family
MTTRNRQASLWIALIAVAVSCLATPADAGESRWYVEALVGKADFDANLDSPCCDLRLDDEVTSAGIEIGYTIHPNFAVQIGYRDLGNAPVLQPPCEICALESFVYLPLEADVTGLSLAAVPRWPINERFSLYGKLGIFHWDADVKFAFDFGGNDRYGSDSQDELLAAAGAHYEFRSGFGVLVEYEVVSDLFDGANLGLTWRF